MENSNQGVQLVNFRGYPMYFTRKDSGVKQLKVKAKTEGGAMINANQISGQSLLTIAVETPLLVGGEVYFNKEKHIVTEILEQREPRGTRFKPGIVFQSIKTEYLMISPIV